MKERKMSNGQSDLAALLCSKLCHDLLSPVGAMNNGLELLADETDPEMQKRCLDLLADSARSAADKLKFFRLAFGAAGGFGNEVDPEEARVVITPLVTGDGRTELAWEIPSGMLPKRAVKILLNLVLIANDAMVRGGNLSVGAENRGEEQEIVIRATGPKLVLDPAIRAALDGSLPRDDVDSRTAPAWMVRDLASEAGGMVQLAEPDSEQLIVGALIKQ